MRVVAPRSRRANASTPTVSRTIATSATGMREAGSGDPASGWWWTVQPNQVRFARPAKAGTAAWYPLMRYPPSMMAPAMPAAAPRPTSGASANATEPEASATRPTQAAYPIAADHGISSPGSVAKAAPASHAQTAVTATMRPRTVRFAASFSRAMRRIPSGVTATSSRLPRRASEASVPDNARMDQRLTNRPSEAPVFQAIEPPRVATLTGKGLP